MRGRLRLPRAVRCALARMPKDEEYVIDVCDQVLGLVASRHHCFEFLRGDTGRMSSGMQNSPARRNASHGAQDGRDVPALRNRVSGDLGEALGRVAERESASLQKPKIKATMRMRRLVLTAQ